VLDHPKGTYLKANTTKIATKAPTLNKTPAKAEYLSLTLKTNPKKVIKNGITTKKSRK
jgi:hypothetical protein